ncbi:peptide chain release factor 1 [Brachyspira murdochii]|uniref:Peptide chain release factor 1 n=1 Tax=Brachyspira murdochii (strain ATCC 51284 / DSM 12563 / 56-150) TaxID=526224 RepID=D5U3M4_BRAM5|nr:peptide chain release factor 1 [Brachyspira murdochii]ADG72106.1 peptide chain release factor 1 [Brachyspira murdochii DSM 12563]
MSIIDKLSLVENTYEDIVQKLNDANIKDNRVIQDLMKKKSEIEDIVEEYRKLKTVLKEIDDSNEMINNPETDKDLKEMALAEIEELNQKKEDIINSLRLLLLPKDKNDGKNIIIEIRVGTGGDESALFVGDLFRMYSRFIERANLKMEIIDTSPTELGGYKEVIFSVSGKNAYRALKFESGTHRVQRIPATESGGRIHTSASTVAVMPEAMESDVVIKDEDIRVDIFRSSGPGGQSVNTTDSAVRITHLPTGLVVQCQDEKSQHKNKAKALKVLRARIYEKEEAERKAKEAKERREQIGSGDRSERIRTYNFPQNRVTDHRINLTLYKLDRFMDGEITEITDALFKKEQEDMLASYSD